jgi:hypothetical protein
MFSMTASMMLVPTAKAALTVPDFAYIAVSTNPCGVGQTTEVIMWQNAIIFGAAPTNNIRFQGYKLVVTAPDGANTSETLPTITSDPTSAMDYSFTPTAVGTYILTFIFPGQTYTFPEQITPIGPNDAYLGAYYEPASASTNLTVQSTPIAAIPPTPLPTTYWMRPIYGENTAWYTLGSNWLGFGSPGYISIAGGPNLGANGEEFGPTTNVGPLTSHVMWTKPEASGGVVGQTATTIAGNTYAEGSAYDQKFTNPIIVDGMLIYTEDISQTKPASGPTVAVNLQTGQQLWSSTSIPALSFAYVYDAEDPNQHGVWPPMLVASGFGAGGTQWTFYDAFTGTNLFTLTNVPAGTALMGPEGEYLIVSLVNLAPTEIVGYGPFGPITVQIGPPQWYLQEWNSSRIWGNQYSGPSTTPDIPPPISTGQIACNSAGVPTGQPVNAQWTGGYIFYEGSPTYVPSLYDFNVSLPWLNTATLNGALINSTTVLGAIQNDMVLAYAGSFPSNGQALFFGAKSSAPYETFGINLNASGTLGTELWHNTLSAPSGNLTVCWGCIDPVNNVFALEYRETMQYVGYSLTTGQYMWGPTTAQAPLDYYGCQASGSLATTAAYGNIYSSAYAGIVYCYSTKTGNIVWTFGNGPVGSDNSTNSGVETPFGNYPTFLVAIGNGVVYTITSEHTEETPIFKGAVARALNATTGQQIWTLSDYTGEFFTGSYAIADGYSTFFNGYDNQIYSVGRGPSQTTVNVQSFGSDVVISGTVMDISAGTKQTEQAADFPNGVPCASDASMAAWMGYVYQQQPEPTNFVGVPVQIAVLDSNGNHYPIGTVTTDQSGSFSLTWSPIIPGNFTVYATFAGTNGYWSSYAEAHFYAPAPSPTPAPTASPPTGLASTGTVELGVVAIIIVIIIIGALILVMLSRKRP